MARKRRFTSSFSSGELSPEVWERYQFEKRDSGLARLENMVPKLQGPVKRRDGSRFVNLAKNSGERVRLIPFIFSRTQAYILELGTNYARLYRDEGQLVDGGSPVEIVTPWLAAGLRSVDFDQDADTMVLVDGSNPTQILTRSDDVTWGLVDLTLRPGPTQAKPFDPTSAPLLGSNVQLSAVSGFGVTATDILANPVPTFLEGDLGRTLVETGVGATGIATIASRTSAKIVTLDIFTPFSQLNLYDSFGVARWELQGSPLVSVAIIDQDTGEPDIDGAVGDRVTLIGYKRKLETNADLIVNGDFTTGPSPFLAPWTDLSGKVLGTGTVTGTAANTMIDTATNFQEGLGAQINHIVQNATNPREGSDIITGFGSSVGGTAFDTLTYFNGLTFNAADTYFIRESGYVISTGANGAELHAGTLGEAALEQTITVDQRSVYEYLINTSGNNLQLQAGTASGESDIYEAVTITPGETRAIIVMPNVDGGATFTLYFQIRNNQLETKGTVTSVVLRKVAVDAWQQQALDAGTYIRINGGYVQTTTGGLGNEDINAVVVDRLDDIEDAIAGSWTIEEEILGKVGGEPTAVTFFQGRLWFGSTNQVFGSVINNHR